MLGDSQSIFSGVVRPSMTVVEQQEPISAVLRIRQAFALPIYTVALILDFASAALGRLAAWIAGDDWPG